MKYRKKPVEVYAIQWTGENLEEVRDFAGWENFNRIHEEDRPYTEDPEASASVYDKLHSTDVLVYDGDFIIRGIKGEYYPCRPDVFEQTYERAA